MSERVRQSLLSSLYESKRIVVAACAALAMVLGAMSVGASVFVHDETAKPTGSSAVFTTTSNDPSYDHPTPEENSFFTQQQVLDTRGVIQKQESISTPTPQAVTPKPFQKNTITEALKSVSSVTIFQNQIELLDNLQTKVSETLANALPLADTPTVETPTTAPNAPASGEVSTTPIDTPQEPASPSDTATDSVSNLGALDENPPPKQGE